MESVHREHPGETTNGVGHPSQAATNAEARISARNPGFVLFGSGNPSTIGRSVGQLRYEKTERGLEVILSPKSTPIKEQYLSFREGKMLCDDEILNAVKRTYLKPEPVKERR